MKKFVVGVMALVMVLMAFTLASEEGKAAKTDMVMGPDVESGEVTTHGDPGGPGGPNYPGWAQVTVTYPDEVKAGDAFEVSFTVALAIESGDLIMDHYMWIEGGTWYYGDALPMNWEEEYTYLDNGNLYYTSTEGEMEEAGALGSDPVTIEPYVLDGVQGNLITMPPQVQPAWTGHAWYKTQHWPVITTWSLKCLRIEENTTFNLFLDEWDGWVIDGDSARSFEVSAIQAKDYKSRAYQVLGAVGPKEEKCKGIKSMTLTYIGGAGADITAYKAEVTDNGDGTYTFTPGYGSGSKMTGSKGSKLKSNTKIFADGVEVAKIHTSCSQPIEVGDVYGDFTISALDKIIEYKPWKEIEKAKDAVWKSLGHGEIKCKGVESLTLSYAGGAGADITAYKAEVTDNGDGTYTFTPDPKSGSKAGSKNKLKSDLKIYVDGVEVAKIHTSCSKPIDVGDIYGDFTITEVDKILEEKVKYKLWQDDDKMRLEPKHGKKVFDYEKKATKELMKLLKDYKKGKDVPWEVAEAAQIAIDDLIDADDLLAKWAILDAKEFAGTCEKVDKEIAKAEGYLCKAYWELEEMKCKGLRSITLEFAGGPGADITAYKADVTDNGDGTYTFTPEDKSGSKSTKSTKSTKSGSKKDAKLPSNLKIYVDGVLVAKIHTSCSKPIWAVSEYDDGCGNILNEGNCGCYEVYVPKESTKDTKGTKLKSGSIKTTKTNVCMGDFVIVDIDKILVEKKEIKYDKAIDNFKKAWEHAQKAIKSVDKCLKDSKTTKDTKAASKP